MRAHFDSLTRTDRKLLGALALLIWPAAMYLGFSTIPNTLENIDSGVEEEWEFPTPSPTAPRSSTTEVVPTQVQPQAGSRGSGVPSSTNNSTSSSSTTLSTTTTTTVSVELSVPPSPPTVPTTQPLPTTTTICDPQAGCP